MQERQHLSILILPNWIERASLSSLRLPILLKRHQLTLYLIPTKNNHRDHVFPDLLVIRILQHMLDIFKDNMPVVLGGISLGLQVIVIMRVVKGVVIGIGTFYLIAREIYNADLIFTGPN